MEPVIDPGTNQETLRNSSLDSRSGGTWSDLRYMLHLLGRYFRSDFIVGSVLIACIMGIGGTASVMFVQAQEKSAAIINAFAARDAKPIPGLLTFVASVGIAYLFAHVVSELCKYMLRMRARQHFTERYIPLWLNDNRFYHLEQDGRVDHPEQRIQEDVFVFIEQFLSVGPGLFIGLLPMVLFSRKLWDLSPAVPLKGLGLDVEIHGIFLIAAVAFAIVWTCVTHLAGIGLTKAEVVRQRLEADFRHEMATIRENGESIAFERGASMEAMRLAATFDMIKANWRKYTAGQLQVGFCVALPGMSFLALPSALCAPFVLSGRMQVGDIQLVSAAFVAVYAALGGVVQQYQTLAVLRSAVVRLRYFDQQLARPIPQGIKAEPSTRTNVIQFVGLKVAYPDGTPLVDANDLTIVANSRILVKGPSGSGKSTLLRAIAGLWPYGSGTVALPASGKVAFLPQRPYMPEGTLASLICYPRHADSASDAVLIDLLASLRLAHLIPKLHTFSNWRRTLSGGEQQRLAVARAIVARPDFLFVDEATSALDRDSEESAYHLMATLLPDTALISVAHRESLHRFHSTVLKIEAGSLHVAC